MSSLSKWENLKLIKQEEVNANVRKFWFEFTEREKVEFTPGQFVTFDLPISDEKKHRLKSYSIASAPDGTNVIELIIVFVEGGKGTHYLFHQIQIGETIPTRGPLGVFTLPENFSNAENYLICTGTGIAPFRSMITFLHKQNKKIEKPIHLIFGSRNKPDLLYYDEMQKLHDEYDNFFYHPTLSREQWEGNMGYVHTVYEKLMQANPHAEKQFMICGWRNMIDEARERLAQKGIGKKQIHFELYG